MAAPLTCAERFIAQPFVCGALGDDAAGLFPRLVAASPAPVTVLHDANGARFAASAAPGLERMGGGWTWGRYVARGTRPRDAHDASAEIGLAGFWVDGQGATVHTDWLGTHDVFSRSIGGTVYWANRLSPLTALTADTLHPDVAAWRMCLLITGFWASSSPFTEITRLDASQRLRYEERTTRVITDFPRWFTSPPGTANVDDLAGAIEAAVPRSLLVRADLTLSGGLDSRLLLAAALRRRSRRPRTWSTHNETGWDGDTRIAGEITRLTRLEHRVVDYSSDEWTLAREATFDRLEHATSMHNWLLPLANALSHECSRTPLIDGLGGDTLMKNHDETLPARRRARMRRAWDALGTKGFREADVVRLDVRESWERDAFESWRHHMNRWDDHPYPMTVVRLLSRTNRAIAASPFRMFAPERHVLTPLIDPRVVRVALSVPPLPPADRDLRPKVLHVLDPRLAGIGATVDPIVNRGSFVERGPTSETAVRSMISAIRAQPSVAELFDSARLDALAAQPSTGGVMNAVRRAAMLAHWAGRWHSRLAEAPSFD